ncbi:MAG: hypothetical protein SGJ18_01545 [Pseudomonadota bacterium]|nr:hypothetical protein [Pseudomonadota bacterium]
MPSSSIEDFLKSRNPANMDAQNDLSSFQGEELESRTKSILLDNVRVTKDQSGENFGVEIGHFVVRGDGDEKEFACGYFERVTLIFRGEGIATSGHPPEMIVSANCEVSKNINRLKALWIPFVKIRDQQASDFIVTFDGYPKIEFKHMSGDWPVTWYLHTVRLDSEQFPERMIEADMESAGKAVLYQLDFLN